MQKEKWTMQNGDRFAGNHRLIFHFTFYIFHFALLGSLSPCAAAAFLELLAAAAWTGIVAADAPSGFDRLQFLALFGPGDGRLLLFADIAAARLTRGLAGVGMRRLAPGPDGGRAASLAAVGVRSRGGA